MSTALNRWMYDIISCTICKRLINYDWLLILWQKQQELVHKNVWIGIFFKSIRAQLWVEEEAQVVFFLQFLSV